MFCVPSLLSLASKERVAMTMQQSLSTRFVEVMRHHFIDQLIECSAWLPPQTVACFTWIAQQRRDFSGSEITAVDSDYGVAGRNSVRGITVDPRDHAHLGDALPSPLENNTEPCRGTLNELPHTMLFSGRDDEIARHLLLEHQPLHLDVVSRMSPITHGVQITEV